MKQTHTKNQSSTEEVAVLELRDVKKSFSVPGSNPLQILDIPFFQITAGELVALEGQSGSGKSTISRLLFRFYDVDQGRITIDGQDLRDVSQLSLRKAIGVVPQDTVLFNDTIAYNIHYGNPEAPWEQVQEAAQLAQIHGFVESLPKGYETEVGERGLKLSGGEKQRVAIARTILKGPRILIFDEATSALDEITERKIIDEIKNNFEKKTVILVSHKKDNLRHCNKIYEIKKNSINKIS